MVFGQRLSIIHVRTMAAVIARSQWQLSALRAEVVSTTGGLPKGLPGFGLAGHSDTSAPRAESNSSSVIATSGASPRKSRSDAISFSFMAMQFVRKMISR